MNPTEHELSALSHQRADLLTMIGQLRVRLNNFTQEDATLEYLDRKAALEKACKEARATLDSLSFNVRSCERWIKLRQEATADQHKASEVTRRLARYQKREQRLLSMGAPESILHNERKLIRECVAPLAELEADLVQLKIEENQQREETGQLEQELTTLKAQYQQRKNELKELVVKKEAELTQVTHVIVSWAAQNDAHLQWLAQHEPSLLNQAQEEYRKQYPQPPVSRITLPPANGDSKRKPGKEPRPTEKLVVATEPKEPPQSTRSWLFVMTDEPLTRDTPLLKKKKKRVTELEMLLVRCGHIGARAGLILSALDRITTMSTQQRVQLHKLAGIHPEGWKIVHAGKYRVFMEIHEDKQRIRFLIRPRNSAYTKNRQA